MIEKPKIHIILFWSLIVLIAIQGCMPSQIEGENSPAATLTSGEVPTWTPRPIDLTQTVQPTATKPATVPVATIVPSTATEKPSALSTPKIVRVSISGGNLFVRRGPSLDYNYVGVVYNGDTILATGRDRVSRWIRIALPLESEVEGWITTETNYTRIDGDISNLPYIETEPAKPAFIRNCTKHELLVRPAEVQLLDKYNEPFNEERFPVGMYQIYDLENPENKAIEEVSLSEGKTVEILYDWTGEKSKCE